MRWFPPFRRAGRDREIAEEIQTHLEMATADRIERGEARDEARRAALREFGNVALIRQTTREVWSWTTLEQLLQDVRFGARILWHAPGLSAAAVILVALVIGGNTTIYSLVHGIMTRPASGVEANRLVCLAQVRPDLDDPYLSYPNYLDYAAHSKTVAQWAAWTNERFTIGVESGSYAVFGALVTPNYLTFSVFASLPVGHFAQRTIDSRRRASLPSSAIVYGAIAFSALPTSSDALLPSTATLARSWALQLRGSKARRSRRERMCGYRSARTTKPSAALPY